ncbi:phage portal protein [Rubinisphaera sp.]|uniref:phage portal protein n=1 Tax=Rubinisphaera sp. TaxID=2024857 RepID=UPI000C0F874A|nr:phage portal protein [Rubinisphaera sp.]MBV12041.1 hypothetical protein [Rubinisphaera sp.]
MLGYVRDKMMTARLRARYERQVQERLSQLVEGVGPRVVSEEPGGWMPVGSGKTRMTEQSRQDLRQQVRELVRGNPHARNVLRLLEAYVVGDGLRLTVSPKKGASIASEAPEIDQLSDLWQSFLEENRSHFSYREYARRVWRDGECFLRLFADQSWPPTVRFIDAERIGPSIDDPESQGIVTNQNDVEDVEGYILLHRDHGDVIQVIPADVVLHTRYGVDTNEKRGVSFFISILKPLEKFQEWQETELLARKLQASIVLWRKVQGGAAQANSLAENARSGTSVEVGGGVRQERVRPGTILTTSAGTEMQYLQPNTNYGDAVPLGRMMLLCAAAGAGIPEFMLTADASNGNYASTMVAEGPAVCR